MKGKGMRRKDRERNKKWLQGRDMWKDGGNLREKGERGNESTACNGREKTNKNEEMDERKREVKMEKKVKRKGQLQ